MSPLILNQAYADFGGTRVLGPINLHVQPGEHIALVGRSGAGKTTLLSLLYVRRPGSKGLTPCPTVLIRPSLLEFECEMVELN